MSHMTLIAANILAPTQGQVAVFTTSTTAIVTTLSASSHLGKLLFAAQMITICAEGGDVYFNMSRTGVDSAAAGTAGPAITDGERSWLLKDGVPQHVRLMSDGTGLLTRMHHACTAAAKKIRVYVSGGQTNAVKSKQ